MQWNARALRSVKELLNPLAQPHSHSVCTLIVFAEQVSLVSNTMDICLVATKDKILHNRGWLYESQIATLSTG